MEGEGFLIPSVLEALEISVLPGQPAPEVPADLGNGRVLETLRPTQVVGPSIHLPDMWGRGEDTITQEELTE